MTVLAALTAFFGGSGEHLALVNNDGFGGFDRCGDCGSFGSVGYPP